MRSSLWDGATGDKSESWDGKTQRSWCQYCSFKRNASSFIKIEIHIRKLRWIRKAIISSSSLIPRSWMLRSFVDDIEKCWSFLHLIRSVEWLMFVWNKKRKWELFEIYNYNAVMEPILLNGYSPEFHMYVKNTNENSLEVL